jgi:hypothetical protein
MNTHWHTYRVVDSIGKSQVTLCRLRGLLSASMISSALALSVWSWDAAAQTKPESTTTNSNPESKACASETCPEYCGQPTTPKTSVGQCVAQCKQSCKAPPPPPPPPPMTVSVTPSYLVMAIAYAPPGCTVTTPTDCGTSNGSSFVDYGSSSSNGTKITTKDSFQLGLTITFDASFLSVLNGGGSYGFQNTTTDTSAVNVTKTQTNDWKVFGNGDGIDHSQDQFFLLLHPKVTLAKDANSTIQWGFNDPGAPFTVYASELQNPATMRPSTKQVFQELALTNADYQNILNEDPFGGTVANSTGPAVLHTAVGALPVTKAAFTTGGTSTPAAPAAPGAGLDPNRFWYTGLSFPYEPALNASNCNNGGVCNCDAYSGSITNENATDNSTEDEGQTTVDLQGGVTVPAEYSLKIDTKLVWTSGSTTDNTTDSKVVASATVTCPSTKYTGLAGVQAWWDTRYGSFVFITYDPGAVPMIQHGKVLSASNQPVVGQLVAMVYNGKQHKTYTAHDGSYGFPSWNGAPAFNGTAQIKTGALTQTVTVGTGLPPIVLQMK